MTNRRLTSAALALTLLALASSAVHAAPALRKQVDQRGNFVLFGNTLGQDCGAGVPKPVVGDVGECGSDTTDTAPDVYWQADAPGAGRAQANVGVAVGSASSSARLRLPSGATVTYARLYWAAESPSGAADTHVVLDRLGSGAFSSPIDADDSALSARNAYQATADVTTLVRSHGVGSYRVSGVDSKGFVDVDDSVNFAAWWLVVFYEDSSEPPRNLTLFDGLDEVSSSQNQTAALSGFLVPAAGFDARLGVVTYEGDDQSDGDSLLMGASATLGDSDRLSDGLNPLDNFFNSTRSELGEPVSVVGDLPQLNGEARSMGGFDLDVVDVTGRLSAGQKSVNIRATSTRDVYYLGGFITSISTFKPDLAGSSKVVSDLNGGAILPGDVLEYQIDVRNSGNDTAIDVIAIDELPEGVNYVPGSLAIVDGPGAGAKSDAHDADQAEYDAASRMVTFRVGSGANGTNGGSLAAGAHSTVKLQVEVTAGALGSLENQAQVSASGQQGSPSASWPTDGNGSGGGSPPTVVTVVECAVSSDCPAAKPVCDAATNRCGPCQVDADCADATPVCDTSAGVCTEAPPPANGGSGGEGGAEPVDEPPASAGAGGAESPQSEGGAPVGGTSAGGQPSEPPADAGQGGEPAAETTSLGYEGGGFSCSTSGRLGGSGSASLLLLAALFRRTRKARRRTHML
ncbi:MAG TPA: DUF3344 domain-containing protein [Polyangiaceae bacterium]|nr:DUF3344 domain-containing protein [Polyangiaceae bacterium]